MTSAVVPIPRAGSVTATRNCAHCSATIEPAKPKNTRYCKDDCRAAAAHARRASRPALARLNQFSPVSPQQAQRHSRQGVIVSLLLLAGLLLGGGLAFAYQQLLADDPLITATQAQLALRRRPAGEFEKQPQARFWLPLCDSGDPLRTSYIAGLVDMQNSLRYPFFCPGSLRVAEMEAIVVKRLRYLSRNAPHLLRYPMLAIASHVLEGQLPCETKTAQAVGEGFSTIARARVPFTRQ
jgi:hypothetical protein